MDPSRMPAAWRKLAAVFTAALPDPTNQEVVVGAQRESSDLLQRVYVAYSGEGSGTDAGDTTMARFGRAWRGIGAKKQDESFDVPCCVVVRSGDDDDTVDADADGIPDTFDELIDQCFALFAAIDLPLRADPGQSFPGPSTATLSSGLVVPDPGLLRIRLPFVVTFQVRI